MQGDNKTSMSTIKDAGPGLILASESLQLIKLTAFSRRPET